MKYALHPGPVRSRHDGRLTYVSAPTLQRLYQLAPDEFIVWDDADPSTYRGRRWGDYLHLYPSVEGRYGHPEDEP